jgi:predicted TIM-barrel fold metal-dependent hydrolase
MVATVELSDINRSDINRSDINRSDDAEVPEFVRHLGLPGLFDVHVHFMPPRLQRKVWAHFDEAGPLIGRDWPIHYRLPADERIAVLRALGVRAFSALSYAHRPNMAVDLNTWSAAFAEDTPEVLRSATFFPETGVLDYVRREIEDGVRVFKAHLQVGGFDPNEAVLEPVWGLLAEAGTPVVVHAGSGPVANGYTGPGPFGEVLDRHPRLTAIIAHMGAPEFAGFLALATRFPKVHLDTAMVFTPFFGDLGAFPTELLNQVRDLGLAGRILLGSDFPTIPYPYATQLAALAKLDLGDDWLRAVCWHNGVRLIGLPHQR